MRGFPKHPAPFDPAWLRGFVERVIDGDTYHIHIALAFNCEVTVPVRLLAVDTPELTTAEGKEARVRLQALIEGQPVMVRSYRDRQSFARWIAEVQFLAPPGGNVSPGPWLDPLQWQDLGAWIIANGLGKRLAP